MMNKLLIAALFGFVLSIISILIKTGSDASQTTTIGVMTNVGFPISFIQNAPGLSAPYFSSVRFGFNCLSWFCIILLLRKFLVKKESA